MGTAIMGQVFADGFLGPAMCPLSHLRRREDQELDTENISNRFDPLFYIINFLGFRGNLALDMFLRIMSSPGKNKCRFRTKLIS